MTRAALRKSLHGAMRVVLATNYRGLLCEGTRDRLPTARAKGEFRRHVGLGVQSHGLPEICVHLVGRAALEMGKAVFEMGARSCRLAVIEPSVPHCEGSADSRASYGLLWIVPGEGAMCGLNISRCDPGPVWKPPHCVRFRSPSAARIARRFEGEARVREQDWERIRDAVLSILADALAAIDDLRGGERGDRTLEQWRLEAEQVRAYVETHLHARLTVEGLAKVFSLHPDSLNRLFHRATGENIHAYLTRLKMGRAMRLCRRSDLMIKQISLELGYDDPLYFSRLFRRHHGMSPREARRRRGRLSLGPAMW